MEWQTKFEERIALLETKISKLVRDMDDEASYSSVLSKQNSELTHEIGKLQAEADVTLYSIFTCCHFSFFCSLYWTLIHVYCFQAHLTMKHERDSDIKNICTKHNLGPVPEHPFTNDVAMNLTNRIKARLSSLENDLLDKKVFSFLELLVMYTFTQPF
jgi:DNA repair protein RAD50